MWPLRRALGPEVSLLEETEVSPSGSRESLSSGRRGNGSRLAKELARAVDVRFRVGVWSAKFARSAGDVSILSPPLHFGTLIHPVHDVWHL